jgi:AAA domain
VKDFKQALFDSGYMTTPREYDIAEYFFKEGQLNSPTTNMKSASNYNMQAAFALLLIGTPKGGKTCFATCFPDPWILDCDNNLAGAVRYHQGAGAPLTNFWYDDPQLIENPDNTTTPRPDKDRWTFCMKAIGDAIKAPEPKTIVVDGLSLLAAYLESHILANSQQGNGMKDLVIAGEKVMNQSHWNPFKSMMMRFVMACRGAGKPFVMTCHETTETNEEGGVIAYRPLISGQLRGNLAGLFTDCWRMESAVVATDKLHPLGVKYSVRFQPRNMMQIGNSLAIKASELDITSKSRVEVWKTLSQFLGMPADLVK